MSNDYLTSILVDQRISEFQQEAAQDRLARAVRAGQPRRPRSGQRWWERLMLFRSRPDARRHAAAAHGTPC